MTDIRYGRNIQERVKREHVRGMRVGPRENLNEELVMNGGGLKREVEREYFVIGHRLGDMLTVFSFGLLASPVMGICTYIFESSYYAFSELATTHYYSSLIIMDTSWVLIDVLEANGTKHRGAKGNGGKVGVESGPRHTLLDNQGEEGEVVSNSWWRLENAKIPFPSFNEYCEWEVHCEQQFLLEGVSELQKVKLLLMVMEGRAFAWQQHYIVNMGCRFEPQKVKLPLMAMEGRAFMWQRHYIVNVGKRNLKNCCSLQSSLEIPVKVLDVQLLQEPSQTFYNFSKSFMIETDASSKGLGAVLLQEGKPLAFWSKAFSEKAQQKSVYEKEIRYKSGKENSVADVLSKKSFALPGSCAFAADRHCSSLATTINRHVRRRLLPTAAVFRHLSPTAAGKLCQYPVTESRHLTLSLPLFVAVCHGQNAVLRCKPTVLFVGSSPTYSNSQKFGGKYCSW
ncbi:hypothetical protein CR513_02008, partial [Mucuna pruriens]